MLNDELCEAFRVNPFLKYLINELERVDEYLDKATDPELKLILQGQRIALIECRDAYCRIHSK